MRLDGAAKSLVHAAPPSKRLASVVLSVIAHGLLVGLVLTRLTTERVEPPQAVVELLLTPVAPPETSSAVPRSAALPPTIETAEPGVEPLQTTVDPVLAPALAPPLQSDATIADAIVPAPDLLAPTPALAPTPVLAASLPLPHRPAPKQVARRIVPLSSTEQRSPPMERSPDVLASVSTAASAAVARPQPAATGTPTAAASWRSAVAAWLAAHKRYPEEARREGREGAVGVSFTVARDGRVETVSIERPSGVPVLDRSAREMLQNHVVPPFPTEMTQAQTDVHVTIRFEMSRD